MFKQILEYLHSTISEIRRSPKRSSRPWMESRRPAGSGWRCRAISCSRRSAPVSSGHIRRPVSRARKARRSSLTADRALEIGLITAVTPAAGLPASSAVERSGLSVHRKCRESGLCGGIRSGSGRQLRRPGRHRRRGQAADVSRDVSQGRSRARFEDRFASYLPDSSLDRIVDSLRRVMSDPQYLAVLARTGVGIDPWIRWFSVQEKPQTTYV